MDAVEAPPVATIPTAEKIGSVKKSGANRKGVAKKKSSTGRKPSSHPPYGAMIKSALKHLNDRKGSSRAAIFKYIIQNYKLSGNMASVNSHLRMALKRGVLSGALKQAKGTGAAGSFRLGEASGGGVRKTKKPRAKKTSAAQQSTGMKKPRVHKKKSSGTKKATKSRKSTGTKRKSSGKKSAGGVQKARRSPKKHAKKVAAK